MSYWLAIPFLGLSALLQATLVPLLAVGGYKVDAPLLLVVSWGLLSMPGDAAVWGFAAGVFLDLVSGLPFGTQTFALTCIGLLLGVTQSEIFGTNILLPPAAMLVSTVLYNVLILAILSTLGWPINWAEYLVRVTLPSALLNTLALPLAYFPLQRLYRRLHPQVEW